jgi:hypothetical protein
LSKYIAPTQISKDLGGEEDWTYEYIEPVPGENDTMKDFKKRDQLLVEREDLIKAFEKTTIDWIDGNHAEAPEIKSKRHELAVKLRVDYWRLDPYLRARSYYDRIGVINSGGVQEPNGMPGRASSDHEVQISANDVD